MAQRVCNTYFMSVESIALDTVKRAVSMGYEVWCEKEGNGWRITVVRWE